MDCCRPAVLPLPGSGWFTAAVLVLVLTGAGPVRATDLPNHDTFPGGVDPPMLARYAGSRLVGYVQKKYDETQLLAGPWKDAPSGPHIANLVHAEGRITRIAYNYGKDRSALEVMRNYRNALQAAGMQVVFSCDRQTCGEDFGSEFYHAKVDQNDMRYADSDNPTSPFNYGRQDPRYLLASAKRADGAVTYAAIYVAPPAQDELGGVWVELVEPEAMETGKVVANLNAEQMAHAIASDGKVALYGLYFDTDKAEVRPDSRPTLEEIARLLRQNAGWNVWVVGHTDNQGSYEHNLDLSQRRADAVVKQLASAYQIDPRRLRAKGVASVAPVSSNDAEAGRARNRRVEIVKQ